MTSTSSITRAEQRTPHADMPPPASDARQVHIIIIGTGFAGLGMAIKLKERGINDFLLLERGEDVGGTWRDNT
jgi:cation diffusion facilitator CzcD-associated flavoprotein CzcO